MQGEGCSKQYGGKQEINAEKRNGLGKTDSGLS